MSPDETHQTSKSAKDNNINSQQGSGGRKTSSSTSSSTKPQEQNMKCPRCDSPNTKFCYYNNYSLTQPRHFCKTCRRYWTKGGALRNVPIGGGCRKNKRVKSSSRLSCDSKDSATSSSEFVGGFKFLHSLSSPSMDFHLGNGLPFPRLQLQHHPPLFNHFSSFGETSSAMNYPATSNSLAAMNYPFSTGNNSNYNGAIQGLSSMNINHGNNNIASSIESLSSMNQDLHWKLQQQRLSMLFGGENQKDNNNQTEKPLQPILFQNLEVSKPAGGNFCVGNSTREATNGGGDTPTEWFFGNSYGSSAATPTTSGGAGHRDNGNNWNGGGVHAWNDVQQQYSAMP
ncbi:unnamed protein product [Vicia faba]|uniref:Dof zinc finger protein n=1 Tax=Vicia faba TaxID=3906 RepID=A0AAV0ZCL1_VICFA|nr:unnamed protein product [Vicia faba]